MKDRQTERKSEQARERQRKRYCAFPSKNRSSEWPFARFVAAIVNELARVESSRRPSCAGVNSRVTRLVRVSARLPPLGEQETTPSCRLGGGVSACRRQFRQRAARRVLHISQTSHRCKYVPGPGAKRRKKFMSAVMSSAPPGDGAHTICKLYASP